MTEKGYVLLPQPIQEQALRLLLECDLNVITAQDARPETVAPLMENARAVVLRTGIKMTAELMNKAKNLLTISRTGAGVDNIDVQAATERGIIVTSSIGVNTSSVVEHCIALILCMFKQLFLLDRELRKGNFNIRYKNLPRDLENKTIGIIGFGRIGSQVAFKCNRLFGTKVVAYDPYLDEEKKEQSAPWVEFVELEKIFEMSDIISVHIPLNDTTRGLINMGLYKLMRPDTYIVNASRGGVVNEKDLVEALNRGLCAGAGLDVFEEEPVDRDNPLLQMENVILTPHTAALTAECVVKMAVSAVNRVIDIFHGVRPANIANPELLDLDRWKHLKER
jgi:D-3-phosphoglycerate dehydrogenase